MNIKALAALAAAAVMAASLSACGKKTGDKDKTSSKAESSAVEKDAESTVEEDSAAESSEAPTESKPEDEEALLKMLANSYLYKDIFTIESIHRPEKVVKLLQALAYQIGSEVSYNELAQMCSMDSKTVEKYVSLLEQAYIIFRLPTYSKNLRNELKNGRKIFFWDCGIRNAVIGNFLPMEQRTDAGALFENFVIAERIKQNVYSSKDTTHWFWRTTTAQEVDFLEISAAKMSAFEFKWNFWN